MEETPKCCFGGPDSLSVTISVKVEKTFKLYWSLIASIFLFHYQQSAAVSLDHTKY